MLRPSSSLFGLSAMMLGLVAATLAAMLLLSGWALTRSFDAIGRAVILDDLGEYEVLYEEQGIDGVRRLFSAGAHEKDHILRIMGVDGSVMLEVLTLEQPHLRWPDPVGPTLEKGETRISTLPLQDDVKLTLGRRKMKDGAELWFGRDNLMDLEDIWRVHRFMWLAAGITALLSIGPVFWFANRVLRPVRSLITSAHQLADGETMTRRLQTTTHAIPELQEFSSAFNASLNRVQQLTEELEAANDQLAHELRTPLARIRGNVEAVLREQQSGGDVTEGAVSALEEVDRATRLVQSILSIRAGDARSMKLHLEMISVKELVTEVCELYSAAAEERGLQLELFVTGGDAFMLLDRERLQQALSNYLDNALAYTPAGGTVSVHLDIEEREVAVRVCDTGPGISESDPQRIWRRFVRGSAAGAKAPGIGLGLSLVRAIAHAHRGTTGCQNRPEGGAEFWIRFPIRHRP